MVKLGDICTFLPKSKRKASFGEITGKYNFYTSSDKVQKCDIADYNEECLIIGSGGVANIKIDNIFSCSADNIILKVPNNVYLYNLIKGNMNLLSDGFTGSTLKHLSKDYLTNLKIPIPKSKQKITEWVNKISKPYDKKNKNEELIMKLEEQIRNKIKTIEENDECDDVELGDLCEFKNGTNITKDKLIIGEYPVVGGGQSPLGYHNIYNVDENTILISKDGAYAGFVSKYNKKVFVSNHGIYISKIKENINKYYIYYLLKIVIQQKLYNLQKGSAQPGVNKADIEKLKIKLPKNKQLIKDFEPLFQQIETLQIELKEAEELYKKLIKELSEEAIPSNKQIEEIKEIEEIEEIKVNKKKKKINKTKNSNL